MDGQADFFAFARQRHLVYINRYILRKPWPWTQDPVLQEFRFTNVYRELDKVTIWFRDHVRGPLKDKPEVLMATVLFRWFNRISTGEAIFLQRDLSGKTAFEAFLEDGDTDHIKQAILNYIPKGQPIVTGSYIILGKQGMDKLNGVLWCIDNFNKTKDWRGAAGYLIEQGQSGIIKESPRSDTPDRTLQDFWKWLIPVDYLGPFMAYEVVTDLRHTAILDGAPDINLWANPGPGAMRGLGRMHGREFVSKRRSKSVGRDQLQAEMRELLEMSRDPAYWPRELEDRVQAGPYVHEWTDEQRATINSILWPAWEMREVEHVTCEFDKLIRARSGEGRPRQKFRVA